MWPVHWSLYVRPFVYLCNLLSQTTTKSPSWPLISRAHSHALCGRNKHPKNTSFIFLHCPITYGCFLVPSKTRFFFCPPSLSCPFLSFFLTLLVIFILRQVLTTQADPKLPPPRSEFQGWLACITLRSSKLFLPRLAPAGTVVFSFYLYIHTQLNFFLTFFVFYPHPISFEKSKSAASPLNLEPLTIFKCELEITLSSYV